MKHTSHGFMNNTQTDEFYKKWTVQCVIKNYISIGNIKNYQAAVVALIKRLRKKKCS